MSTCRNSENTPTLDEGVDTDDTFSRRELHGFFAVSHVFKLFLEFTGILLFYQTQLILKVSRLLLGNILLLETSLKATNLIDTKLISVPFRICLIDIIINAASAVETFATAHAAKTQKCESKHRGENGVYVLGPRESGVILTELDLESLSPNFERVTSVYVNLCR